MQGSQPSLDSASVTVPNAETGENERVDVPMRAFTEGYYHNLKAMYDYLDVRYRVQPFLFSFSRLLNPRNNNSNASDDRPYFLHASNTHRFPPMKPESIGLLSYTFEVLFALLCYVWLSVCCLYVSPKQGDDGQTCESFGQYLQRIKLPQHFVHFYLLPLMSAVTTCPHKTLLAFPASDVVTYKKCITSGRHLTVAAGVNEVQQKLMRGVKVHFSAAVTSVQAQERGVRIVWRETDSSEKTVAQGQATPRSVARVFDKVVLAVPPNVVGSVFEPLRKEMQRIPTTSVETVVHYGDAGIGAMCKSIKSASHGLWFATSDADRAHVIHLRTAGGPDACTEATHVQPSGAMVTSCPLKKIPSRVVQSSSFTRVLRTPESRRTVNKILGSAGPAVFADEKSTWRNGDDGVYLVGSWCWDGMVLLEGCVVSAMRTASALGVEVPWGAPREASGAEPESMKI